MTAEEVDILLREGEKLAPVMAKTRILRAYSGVRPLVASDDDPSGRNVSRGIVLLDHAERDGLDGFITITGGKLMTYRLMAEWATDAVCRKLGNTRPCTTADLALPGSQEPAEVTLRKVISLPAPLRGSAVYRHGDRTPAWLSEGRLHRSLVCECEAVTAGEVQYAVENLNVNSLLDLRRRTRVGMGTCQGELCACRAAGLLQRFNVTTSAQSIEQLSTFLNERWKGVQPIATARKRIYPLGLSGIVWSGEGAERCALILSLWAAASPDYSVACNCKNTACAVPLSLVVKARCISHLDRWIC